jgi:hypothetical protein
MTLPWQAPIEALAFREELNDERRRRDAGPRSTDALELQQLDAEPGEGIASLNFRGTFLGE